LYTKAENQLSIQYYLKLKEMKDQLIFEPFDLNGLSLSNRIVVAPMTRNRSANPGNVATEITPLYYQQSTSAGLIITDGNKKEMQ